MSDCNNPEKEESLNDGIRRFLDEQRAHSEIKFSPELFEESIQFVRAAIAKAIDNISLRCAKDEKTDPPESLVQIGDFIQDAMKQILNNYVHGENLFEFSSSVIKNEGNLTEQGKKCLESAIEQTIDFIANNWQSDESVHYLIENENAKILLSGYLLKAFEREMYKLVLEGMRQDLISSDYD